MIELMFDHLNEKVIVIIDGKQVKFGNTSFGTQLANIDGLQLNHEGVIKEHPDLKDNKDWEKEAKKRFKEKIDSLKDEEEISNYIISDLKKHNYIIRLRQKKGFRPEVIK